MDLDVGQVRAFVAVADEGHFGRAAVALSVSQQALSKRIARLEAELGARLLIRGVRATVLSEAGQRFLGPARRLVTAADLAVAAARQDQRPLRLDMWGHLFLPMRTVRQALQFVPDLPAETGLARDQATAISALLRHDIDAGFGRISPSHLAGADLTHRLVRLDPLDVVLGAEHELADRDAIRPADLTGSTLIFPAAGERLDFLTRFADSFGVTNRSYGANLGLRHLLDRLREDRRGFTLLPADVPVATPGIRVIPMTEPVPLYAWSLIWNSVDPHPRVPALLDAFGEAGQKSRWLEFCPTRDWLPGPDLADALTAHPEPTARPASPR